MILICYKILNPPQFFFFCSLLIELLNFKLRQMLFLISLNGGVPRHLSMSIGFEQAHNPDAISKMIKDEQIKVTGCRFASSRGRSVKRCSASIRLRVFFSGTPPLINVERSGMLINVLQLPRSSCFSFNLRVELCVKPNLLKRNFSVSSYILLIQIFLKLNEQRTDFSNASQNLFCIFQ